MKRSVVLSVLSWGLVLLFGCESALADLAASRHVFYEANGGTGTIPIDPSVYRSGASATVMPQTADLNRLGWSFENWNTSSSGGGHAYEPGDRTRPLEADLTLFAQWHHEIYTVSFNNGSTVTGQTHYYGDLITPPAPPTKGGYHFSGWCTDVQGTHPWIFASDLVEGSLVLYAHWTVGSYTVSFDSRGGSGVAAVGANNGSLVLAPSNPERFGYAFSGWYRESTCTTPWVFATDTVASDVTLYAKWTSVYTEVGPDTALAAKTSTVSVSGVPKTHNFFFRVPTGYNADMTQSFPLFVFLHPWGVNTSNPGFVPGEVQGLPTSGTHKAFVYVPVCPPPYLSNTADPLLEWNSPDARAMVINTIVDLTTRFHIDPKRIYVTGFSMGGAGSWYLGYEYNRVTNSRFAAVSRGSGWYLSTSVTNHDTPSTILAVQNAMSNVPTWIHVGQIEGDGFVVGNANFNDLVARFGTGSSSVTNRANGGLLSAGDTLSSTLTTRTLSTGAETRLEVYTNRDHEDLMWRNTDLLDWIFAQHL